MNTDGTGLREVATPNEIFGTGADWSPDGSRIVFDQFTCVEDDCFLYITTVGADSTPGNEDQIGLGTGFGAVWSPNGSIIAFNDFVDGNYEIYTVPANGGTRTRLTNNAVNDFVADFSPDGTKILFGSYRDGDREIYKMDVDGTDPVRLTDSPATDGASQWSPDGRRIAFSTNRDDPNPSTCSPCNYEIYTMDPDGTNLTRLTDDPGGDGVFDWQPIIRGYPRPQGARSLRVPLAIAYDECPPPGNRTHGPALSFPSCSPATQSSSQLTVGTIDANGESPKFNGAVRYFVQPGNPGTAADEADVDLDLLASDVRLRSDLSDYTGELTATVTIRITDRQNQPSPPSGGHGTVTDLPVSFTAPCSATPSDATVGSTCQVSTSADSVVPGAAVEGKRAIWELGQVQVYDGAGTLFATQGVFIP